MRTATYEQLLAETLPSRIDSEEQYDSICSHFGELLRKSRRSAAEERLADLLSVLIEEYDRRNAMPPDNSTPGELLQFLLDHSGKTIIDLLPVFHQRTRVNEVLSGKREISLEQAKRLGRMFHVKPWLFRG